MYGIPSKDFLFVAWKSRLFSVTEFTKELARKKIKLSLADEADWEVYFTKQKQSKQTLKSEIDLTDREIERMVCELYGLVEG